MSDERPTHLALGPEPRTENKQETRAMIGLDKYIAKAFVASAATSLALTIGVLGAGTAAAHSSSSLHQTPGVQVSLSMPQWLQQNMNNHATAWSGIGSGNLALGGPGAPGAPGGYAGGGAGAPGNTANGGAGVPSGTAFGAPSGSANGAQRHDQWR
jgi:hypothetical protein